MMLKIVGSLVVAAALVGCATAPEEIVPRYVPTDQYEDKTCRELSVIQGRLVNQIRIAEAAQRQAQQRDAAMVATSALLFWPAMFFIEGDGATAEELARLKGELDATLVAMETCR